MITIWSHFSLEIIFIQNSRDLIAFLFLVLNRENPDFIQMSSSSHVIYFFLEALKNLLFIPSDLKFLDNYSWCSFFVFIFLLIHHVGHLISCLNLILKNSNPLVLEIFLMRFLL